MNKFFLYLIVLLIPFWANAQIELKGVVIDAKTKEPLPYVNYIISSTTGGMTDDSGRFEITASAKTDSVIFTYLGYKDEVLKKRFFKKDSIVVRMQLENFMLEEFTVKAPKGKLPKDTVAIRIFRNVVKHKDENRTKSFDSYQYEEYLKTVASLYNVNQRITSRKIFKPFRFILENQDTTADGTKYVPLILKETITDHYHTSDPKHTKAIVKAS
ncbi:MAG TPA: carboxypeptidase-like regulatory domain-containing protein, partial [Chitinophagales bacterium]|nr:carboxypeptidase-like regulatory domain-containing protein [Chitinophagales bacterium]